MCIDTMQLISTIIIVRQEVTELNVVIKRKTNIIMGVCCCQDVLYGSKIIIKAV